jgi:murein DD-endopeptidase MepM/ murein hydrolase activator NlpD
VTVAKRRNPSVEPWQIAIPVGAVALTAAAIWATVRLLGRGLPPGVVAPMQFRGVPFAEGTSRPAWPVHTNHPDRGVVSYEDINGQIHGRWARKFGAPRDGRYHVGVDVFAYDGDPVLAMDDGVVIKTQTYHLGTHAMLVDHDGLVVLYGEIDPKSWNEFGVAPGVRVRKGQPIARVGCMVWSGSGCSSHMLHLETYTQGTTKNIPWYVGNNAPPNVLDPTMYLLRASER